MQTLLSGPFTVATIWAALLVGLAGGFGHCVAMCGPIVAGGGALAGVSTPGGGRVRRVALWQLAYHSGRLLTYTGIGAALGGIGSLAAVRSALGPLQQVMWLVVGEVMIFMGLAIAGVPLLARFGRRLEERYASATKGWIGRAIRALPKAGPGLAFPLGMLMGFMPCGFLMSIEVYAVGTGSWLSGGLTMLAFGIGTVPALAGFGAAGGLLSPRARTWLIYIGAAIVVALGALYVARALTGGMAMMR